MLLMAWKNVGQMAMNITYPSLPLTSVDRCPAAVTNDTSLWQQSNVTVDWTSASSANQSYYPTQVGYVKRDGVLSDGGPRLRDIILSDMIT